MQHRQRSLRLRSGSQQQGGTEPSFYMHANPIMESFPSQSKKRAGDSRLLF
jgi:predicted DNA-binding transcriptional regulator AlpA